MSSVAIIDDETEKVTTMHATPEKVAIALRVNEMSTARLTAAVRRVIGPDYYAATCAGVCAIVLRRPGGTTEAARGRSWAEALAEAKRKWQWDLGGMKARRDPGFDPTENEANHEGP